MNGRPSTSRNTLVSLADTVGRQAIQFGFTIILARLLAPEEFGLLAMLAIFIGLASVMAEGGLGVALIQRQATTPLEESSVFYFNAAIGAAMTLLLALAAPYIAMLYGEPRLVAISAAMSLNVLFNALGAIHVALLVREGRLGVQLRIGLLASVLSGSFGVALALRGYGAWSLVGQSLLGSATFTALLWASHRWRPVRAFSMQALRPLLHYSVPLMASGVLDAGFGRLHTLLIGRLHGASSLGLYMRASTTQQLPQIMLSSAMQRVALPAMAARQRDGAHMLAFTRASLRSASLLYLPAMLGMAAIAEPLVPFLFGPGWAPSIPVLQVLCLAGTLYPLHQINLILLKAMGHSRLFLRLEVLKKSVLVALLLVAVPMGLLAVAWSTVGAGLVAVAINGHYTRRLVGYGLSAQLRDFAPFLGVALAMAGVVWWLGQAITFGPATELLAQAAAGILVYGGACLGLGLITLGELRAAVTGVDAR
ncbi:lipopolysaccharide biosynthesis protein [Ramlibacter sp.]|uniref:lipopolysaccharide biosynthesis protein n=1 Tax=Ramlibacter sp. TaxID=1917967 RepID=UPI002FC81F2D